MSSTTSESDTIQAPSRSRFSIAKLRSEEEITALREDWQGLTEIIPDCPFFLTWEWISTWWRYLGVNNELWLLTARDTDDHLAGLAPWMRGHRKVGPITFRWLSFIGSGLARPAHLDIIARPGEEEILSAAFLQYLQNHRGEWDVLVLEGLRQRSPLVPLLSVRQGKCARRQPVKCAFVSLPTSWETFQQDCMTAKLRKTIRYYERRLEKHAPGKVVFLSASSESDLDAAVEFLIRNSRRLFRQRGFESSFEDHAFVSFYHNMARIALQQGYLRFYQLKVDDQIIAVQSCFRYKEIVYGYQTAFDSDWGKYSPGQQLLAHVFREAIREKAGEVDMMHGDTDYKSAWASDVRQDAHILYALNWWGKLWLLGINLVNGIIFLSRKVLPESMRQKINRRLARNLS